MEIAPGDKHSPFPWRNRSEYNSCEQLLDLWFVGGLGNTLVPKITLPAPCILTRIDPCNATYRHRLKALPC